MSIMSCGWLRNTEASEESSSHMQTISARANLQLPRDGSRINKAKDRNDRKIFLYKKGPLYTRTQRDATVVGESVEQATVWFLKRRKGANERVQREMEAWSPSVTDQTHQTSSGSFGKGLKLGHCHLKYILLSFIK